MIDFNYEPLSEQEAEKCRYHLLEDGIYQGVIQHADSRLSASGNPMGVFTLTVWDKDGTTKEIIDYVPFINSMMWKARHLCEALGLIKEFEEKKFRPELTEGRSVTVSIKTQEGKEIPHDKLNGKPPGSKYPDKNVVLDYLLKDNAFHSEPTNKKEIDDEFRDDIPF